MKSALNLQGLDELVQSALRAPRPSRAAPGVHAQLYRTVKPLLNDKWSVPKVVDFLLENRRLAPACAKSVAAALNYHWRRDRLATGQGKLRQRQPKTTTSPTP